MAAFRIFSKLDTFTGLTNQLLAGGYLTFCEAETTTPKNVYGEIDLTTNNGSTVDLDSSGRPDVDVWGSGAYFVELFDSADVKQGEADNVQIPGGEDTALPTPVLDGFLVGDGSTFVTTTISQVPDMTGQSGKVLGTDGTSAIWQSAASTVTDSVLLNVRETVQSIAATATTTINFALGAVVDLSQAVDITTLALTGAPDAGEAATLTIFRIKDNTGTTRAITWPASVVWLNGSPTLPQTANALTAFTLITTDGGATWRGTHSA